MRSLSSFVSLLTMTSVIIAISGHAPAIAQSDQDPPQNEAPETMPDAPALPPTAQAAVSLLTIVTAIDDQAQIAPNGATFSIDDVTVTLVFDINADRMRLFSQIVPSDALSGPELRRLMQANFDTALDARYAIAQGQLWSTFIHPLASLTQEDFVSALAQTVTLVKTYGTTFSSGAMSFGGGDSSAEIQKLLERLLDENEI
ncbi:MAG: hypothetical protein AAF437_03615 [Pseudomonadota bacterium]